MPTTAEINITVRNGDMEIIGHVRNQGCENDACIAAIVNGRRWHAIPKGQGVTLPDYHFQELDDAVYALLTAEHDR